MAKDRKRSKQRRPRTDAASRGPERPSDHDPALSRAEDEPLDEAPEPLDHASADVDIANAQLAVGRPDAGAEADGEEFDPEDRLDPGRAGTSAPDELQEDVPVAASGRDARRARRLAAMRSRTEEEAAAGAPVADRPEPGEAAPVPATAGDGAAPAEAGRSEGPRFVAFLQGSWRELQRVQWPDRQQVAQATAVVLVFVVIAGLYLGLTGEIASRLVKALL